MDIIDRGEDPAQGLRTRCGPPLKRRRAGVVRRIPDRPRKPRKNAFDRHSTLQFLVLAPVAEHYSCMAFRPPRQFRCAALLLVLLLSVLAVQPGFAEVIELGAADGDCSEPCPRDSADGNCPSSCTDCQCCARAMSALLSFHAEDGAPALVDEAPSAEPASVPLEVAVGIFHPPRT